MHIPGNYTQQPHSFVGSRKEKHRSESKSKKNPKDHLIKSPHVKDMKIKTQNTATVTLEGT
jgi:hypothetical protein